MTWQGTKVGIYILVSIMAPIMAPNGLRFLSNSQTNINDNRGSYILNNKKELRVFTCQDVGFMVSACLSIGGKLDGTHLLKGAISALEIYVDADNPGEDCVPDQLKHLIVSSQLIETKHENHEEPSEKKKKLQPTNE